MYPIQAACNRSISCYEVLINCWIRMQFSYVRRNLKPSEMHSPPLAYTKVCGGRPCRPGEGNPMITHSSNPYMLPPVGLDYIKGAWRFHILRQNNACLSWYHCRCFRSTQWTRLDAVRTISSKSTRSSRETPREAWSSPGHPLCRRFRFPRGIFHRVPHADNLCCTAAHDHCSSTVYPTHCDTTPILRWLKTGIDQSRESAS